MSVQARPSDARDTPGRGLAASVRRHPLGWYVGLALGLSWAWWVPLALLDPSVTHAPGLLGPMLAGFVVTGVTDGRRAVARLGARMVRWRVPLRWYLAAVAPLALGLSTVLLLRAAGVAGPVAGGGGATHMPGFPDLGWVGLFLVLLVVNGYGEEVGWRGVAWPRLREGRGVAAAAGVLTIVWAVWHVPTFWLDTGLADIPLPVVPAWLVGLFAGAVVLGWLYEQCGSLLIVALFHAGLNLASATRATEGLPAAVTTTGVVVAGVVILRHDHRAAARTATS